MKKKPKFKRQNSLLKKLKDVWRKPKGIHSKLRLKKRGKGKRPKIGYGNNKRLKELIKNKDYTYISNMNDMNNVKHPIIISSTIGLKKKIEIAKRAEELKISIINIDVKKLLERMKTKKEKKQEGKIKEKPKEEKKAETKEEKEKKFKEEKKKVLEKGI